MPITQERFLLVLRGAKAILDKERSLLAACEDAEQLLSSANAALDMISEPRARNSLTPLLGLVNTLTTIARGGGMVYDDLKVTVLAELKHFDKKKVSNSRAAERQRNMRERNGVKPHQDYLLGEQLAPTMTPTLQPLYLEGTSNYEADQQQEPAKPVEGTPGFNHFEKQMEKLRAAGAFAPKGEEK